MEDIQQKKEADTRKPILTLADRVKKLEEDKKIADRTVKTERAKKDFRWPFKWKAKFNKANKKTMRDMMLVFFLNKKNEIEQPKFMPIFDGNMIIWNDSPYEFDPRAVWTVRGVRGNPKAYVIKEIDRRPVRNKHGKIMFGDSAVSNMDVEEIRARGDSTESDKFLIKTALRGFKATEQKKKISIIAIIAILAIIGVVLWLVLKGG